MTGAQAVGESILKQSYKDEIACSRERDRALRVAVHQLAGHAFPPENNYVWQASGLRAHHITHRYTSSAVDIISMDAIRRSKEGGAKPGWWSLLAKIWGSADDAILLWYVVLCFLLEHRVDLFTVVAHVRVFRKVS